MNWRQNSPLCASEPALIFMLPLLSFQAATHGQQRENA
jgi:hypothetical protein